MYARPQVSGLPVRFGVSGRLWRNALVLFDRETGSLWSQVDGGALAGPLAGRTLAEIPSEVTTWGTWRRRHPDTRVLSHPGRPASPYRDYQASPTALGVAPSPNPDPRLPPKELVVGFAAGRDAVAVPVEAARRAGVVELSAGGRPLAVFAPAGEATVVAFERRAGGRELRFVRIPGERSRLRDTATGSTWDGATGRCLSGPLAGESLPRATGRLTYWGVWARFHPGGRIVP